TYSLTTPLTKRISLAAKPLYEALHATLIEVLRGWRIDAHVAGKTKADAGAPPFLCFQRHTPEDVLLGEAKVCGSAQRRHRGALLQHGSVIVQTSDYAPEIAGIHQLSGIPIEPGELAAAWQNALAMRLNLALESRPLTSVESRAAREIRDARFGSDQWTRRR
ncbi:MAG: lipoyl protein ligase domain-containing protein, partial [Gammaproteobacteria bacterium]